MVVKFYAVAKISQMYCWGILIWATLYRPPLLSASPKVTLPVACRASSPTLGQCAESRVCGEHAESRYVTLQWNDRTQSRRTLTNTASVITVVGISGVASVRVAPWLSARESACQTVLWADCNKQHKQLYLSRWKKLPKTIKILFVIQLRWPQIA